MPPVPPDDRLVANDIHIQATYRLTEALVASEKRMRRRVELLSEVVLEADEEGRLVFLNRAWKSILGYDPESCLGASLRDYVVDEDRTALDSVLGSASQVAAGSPVQIRLIGRDGATVWMEFSAAPSDEGGVVGALRDITHQKRAQDELARLSIVASSTDNLVIITDRHGYIEWVNQAFTRRTGYSNDEVRGLKPGSFLQGPETDQKTVGQIRQWLSEGRSFQCDLVNYTKAGEAYWTTLNVTPIRNAEGSIERFISVQTDSTHLRRTQQELELAKRAAEAASEAKSHFLATISHEMRTPLTVILGATELALEGGSAVDFHHNLARIRESGETLLRLISDLLDVSKIEAGQIEFEIVPFRLRHCLQEALDNSAARARSKGLSFEFVCDEQLPESVCGDPGRLRQIVVNLVENAVKFTDAGYVRIEASCLASSSPETAGLALSVADSGIGISAEQQARVFERFAQANRSTNRTRGGAGLGLSIVKSLTEAMGGTVSLESAPLQGTVVQIRLPLAQASVPTLGGHAGEIIPTPAGRGLRILVADDNDSIFAIVERHLSNAGYVVDRAANGRQAVEMAAKIVYHLVLMDIEMPEVDGFEATRLIRADEAVGRRPRVPIVALTAHATKGYQELCLEAGCTGYLAKPIRKPALLEAVAAIGSNAAEI